MRKPDDPDIQRRNLLTGRLRQEDEGFLHVSSAIVLARPEHVPGLARSLAALPGTEVHAAGDTKIVLVMEGRSSDEIGARMAAISVMDRVISASMVFEQILPPDENGAEA